MFCKNCGKELWEGVKFCPDCGTAAQAGAACTATRSDSGSGNQTSEGTFDSTSSTQANKENAVPKPDEAMKFVPDGIAKTNPFCIAALVLTILMFFFNYYGVVSYAALILALIGFRSVKRSGEKGLMLSIVCMAVSGIVSLISIMRIVEYNRYMAASYGELDALLQWLGDWL